MKDHTERELDWELDELPPDLRWRERGVLLFVVNAVTHFPLADIYPRGTHCSFSVWTKRSTMPFCCGQCGVMNSCFSP